MQLRTSRRIAAGVLAGALTCALATAPTADAGGGRYSQILCANPDTNQGVLDANGQFPAGMTLETDRPEMSRLEEWASCARGEMSIWRGVSLQTRAPFSTNVPDSGGVLKYRAPADITFDGAELYRTVWLPPSNWATSIHSGEHTGLFGSPGYDTCEWFSGCTGRGSSADPWHPDNQVTFGGGGKVPGFNITLKCNIAGPAHSCSSNGDQYIELYGGKVVLEDANDPRIEGTPSGGLAADDVLAGTESLSVNASDVGSGVYRAIVSVDGDVRRAEILDANQGRCADANLTNDDPHEFAYGRPCKLSAGGKVALDTTKLPEGAHSLTIAVEDASGNLTELRDETVTVDNVPAPTVVSAPQVVGGARRGTGLAVEPGAWNDHGVDGDPEVAYQWQRCERDGSGCVDLAGATSSTYTLTSDDLGGRVRVVESAANSEGRSQAASALTAVVTREDGTLPPDRDGIDNDGDGKVDEPGEQAPTTDEASGAGNTRPPATQTPSAVTPPASSGSSASSSPEATAASAVNGEGASRRAALTATFARRGGNAYTAPHGRRVEVTGRLVDEHGRPIRHAAIEVTETSLVRGAAARPSQPVLTRSDGGFTYQVDSRSGGRALRFSYRYVKDGSPVSEAGLTLKVAGAVRLSVALKGTVVTYKGSVLARPLPRGGKVVIVQGRAAGGRWQTFASRRTSAAGAFRGRYRLKIRRPGARLQFRARAVAEAGWPYEAGTSRAVTRKVR